MASTCTTGKPQNGIVQAVLTDLYQISMAYAYWESGKRNEHSVFDLYFRTNPFQGEFTIFAGLHECISYLQNFRFTETDIEYLRSEVLPKTCKPEFFDYLRSLTTKDVILYAIPEGTVVFPRIPLLRVEGPLPVAQLLETTLLNLINYASLVATNAARFRIAAGKEKTLLEFGLRRAQGPDGALSASKYCYIGGFDGTSNVLAGKKYGIPCRGTQAHAFVSSYLDTDGHHVGKLRPKDGGEEREFLPLAKQWLERIAPVLDIPLDQTSPSELIAFSAFAVAFPTNFLALVDTYNVIRSGLPNFCAAALALNDFGYKALGIRLDSGDLAYLSKMVRQKFVQVGQFTNHEWFRKLIIVASNDLNEETIYSLQQQGHEIDSFGIGTHLVTCQKQPALGCVYKLVEINTEARMKISEEVKKVTIPGRKDAYRLYGADGKALVDLIQTTKEPPPLPESRALCRHPIVESKRAYVKPSSIECLLKLYFKDGKVHQKLPSLHEIKDQVQRSLSSIRVDHLRPLNPTPYKVSVSDSLYNFMHQLWLDHAPIGELS